MNHDAASLRRNADAGQSPHVREASDPGPPSQSTAPNHDILECMPAAIEGPPPAAAAAAALAAKGPSFVDGRDVEALAEDTSEPPYSTFSRRTKMWIITMVFVSSIISPMTANIYFPALDTVATSLDVSTALINLTVTTYMIMQALAPMIFGDFGDTAGRRPAFTIAFTIYLFANIALALQRDYVALMILRCVQSAGSSGTLALAYAVVADVAPSEERGMYMGIVGAGINLGPTVGPVVGGLLSKELGWPSIFWFCTIFVLIWLIPWVLSVPETCRNVVGNGSIPSPRWSLTVIDLLRSKAAKQRPASAPRVRIRLPNPLRTLHVVFKKEEGLILFISAIMYVNFILIGATLATLFKLIYDYDDLEAGVCYLPYGVGCCAVMLVQGYIVDWNYARIAKKLGVVRSTKRGADMLDFPIESARIQPLYPAITIGAIALVGWGWSLEAETTVAVPLILLFIIGMMVPSSFGVLNTLLVDLNEDAPATAAAANNLTRCLSGATATAVVDFMFDAMGMGWTFTLLALLMVACLPGLRVLEKFGPRWRAEKAAKKARKQDGE
ncbi:Major facilitator superfamily domain, general substrate transporter [Moelleriella libera RCEF 2490]|uniref:Major facilitator superfamily domain, general substrate transporter n=1 Tax=Moelleriella libera RCEF 2490 TaxID=1081109 RepID=A0A168BJ63_9HYPO|nr:Major facilitator superfamily domain, general substrate transporter [Moelleriella libera RCEF 2490]